MAFGLCSRWTCLWSVTFCVGVFAGADSLRRYSVSHSQASFDQASQRCAPGTLTTFITKQEIDEILKLVSEPPQSNFSFWVGLKKDRKKCVHSQRPLRGFRWTENGSEDSEEAFWAQEPQPTCTSVLCAAVSADLRGSAGIRWALMSVSCRNRFPFVCKLRDGQMPEHGEGGATELASPEPATSEPETPPPEPSGPEPQPEPETVPTTGPEHKGPALGSESCRRPVIPESRYITSAADDGSIRVQCWSGDQLELSCQGRPARWLLPDDSPANLTVLCRRCEVGFRKDASANCVDVDECSGGHAPCRHTCLNTEGSYRCVCPDPTGQHHPDEDSPACADSPTVEDGGSLSGILIPVLVAVVTLLVVVVVVVVTIKCCLMRRLKKKAENITMKNRDSKESFAEA